MMAMKDKNMLKPLLVIFDYHIQNSATGQIARTFWGMNKDNGFVPTIICGKQKNGVQTDDRTIEVLDSDIIRHLFGLVREIGFPDLCHCPDQRRFSWMPFVFLKYKKTLAKEKFDYIHSISCPDSSHLIAYKIKKRSGLPWIAQFNDPWIGNEAQKYKTQLFSRVNDKLEQLVAENADLIIHSNRIIYEDWVDRYGESIKKKMVIFPFSFNIQNLPEVIPESRNPKKIRIYHIGSLYGVRSAKSFFRSLNEFRLKYCECADSLEVNFIGGVPDSEKEFAKELGLQDCVNFLGVMPPEQLEQYYKQSDLFLVIDMKVQRSPSYPSKLLLYHYYRKPIMSITTNDSIIMDDMEKSGHNAFLYDDISGMVEYLHRSVSNYGSLQNFDHNHWQSFTVENVTSLYKEQLRNLSII